MTAAGPYAPSKRVALHDLTMQSIGLTSRGVVQEDPHPYALVPAGAVARTQFAPSLTPREHALCFV
jgi:hypothetical protein